MADIQSKIMLCLCEVLPTDLMSGVKCSVAKNIKIYFMFRTNFYKTLYCSSTASSTLSPAASALLLMIPLTSAKGLERPQERMNLATKKRISTPLRMEKPVRSPIVPPMRLSWASSFTFLSLLISSNVAVSKKIWIS